MPVDENTIDGDRVIAFIRAIEDLGKILNQLNVIEVKDAFIKGKHIGSIDNVIELRKEWLAAVEQIRVAMKLCLVESQSMKNGYSELGAFLKSQSGFLNSGSFIEGNKQLKEFNDQCQRFEHYKTNGTLEAVLKIVSQKP